MPQLSHCIQVKHIVPYKYCEQSLGLSVTVSSDYTIRCKVIDLSDS